MIRERIQITMTPQPSCTNVLKPTREFLGDSLDLVVEEEADGPDVVGPHRRVEHGSAAVQPHAGVDVSAVVDEQRHHGEAGLGGGGG